MREGSLADTPYALLLLALSVEQRTAVLILQKAPLEKHIVFEQGSPIECQSNVATETLGRFMVAGGKLNDATFQSLLNESASRKVSFESLLVEKRVIEPQELERIRQQNLARKLLDPFSWQNGTFRIETEVPQVEAPLRVRVPQLVLSGIVKLVSQEEIDRAVEPHLSVRLRRNKEPYVAAEELRMVDEQTQLLDAVSRGEPATAAATRIGLAQEEASRFLFAALLFGTVVPEQQQAAGARSESPLSSRPAAAEVAEITRRSRPAGLPFFDDAVTQREPLPPPAAAAAANASEADRTALIETYEAYRSKDAFELLDLREDAGIGATGAAFLGFAQRFAPWRFGDDADAREKARELFLGGARAYGELVDSEQRQRILTRRKGSSTATGPARPTVSSPPAAAPPAAPRRPMPPIQPIAAENLLDPEVQYRKGKELFDAGRPREALSFFEFAANCDAQNGVYAAELAYCRFQLLQTSATQAVGSLRQVLRFDPKCGLAYLYLGKILAAIGNAAEAEGNLRKATQLMRTDKRPYEALQALSRK